MENAALPVGTAGCAGSAAAELVAELWWPAAADGLADFAAAAVVVVVLLTKSVAAAVGQQKWDKLSPPVP